MRRYKNWACKIISWKYLTIWRRVLPVFPRAQSASFLISTLNSFQGCWKSAAAAAHDLILVEVDAKCQWQVPIRSWQSFLHSFNSQNVCPRGYILVGEGVNIQILKKEGNNMCYIGIHAVKKNTVAKKSWKELNFHISWKPHCHWDVIETIWKKCLNEPCKYLAMDI